MHVADPGASGSLGPGRLAWFDVSAGVAGDMLCAALVDSGVPLAVLQEAADAVVPGCIRWEQTVVRRAGFAATMLTPHFDGDDRAERHWMDISQLLRDADLPLQVQDGAIAIFARLASAEAAVHGVEVEDIHFHEVGGLDTFADVVGVVAGLHHLGVGEVLAGPMAVGSGSVRAAHGVLPVPVPAVVRLCRGWQVESGGPGELATPTGAAIVTTMASACVPLPAMALEFSGAGAGRRDNPDRANVVRVLVGPPDRGSAGSNAKASTEVVLEANVDDLDPRLWAGVIEALLANGAADVWLTPIMMKKGRPAHTVSVLCPSERELELRDLLLKVTSSVGCRVYPVTKHALARTMTAIEVSGNRVTVKIATDANGTIAQAMPEFDDVARAAAALERPVREVLEQARAEVRDAGLVPGTPAPALKDEPG